MGTSRVGLGVGRGVKGFVEIFVRLWKAKQSGVGGRGKEDDT